MVPRCANSTAGLLCRLRPLRFARPLGLNATVYTAPKPPLSGGRSRCACGRSRGARSRQTRRRQALCRCGQTRSSRANARCYHGAWRRVARWRSFQSANPTVTVCSGQRVGPLGRTRDLRRVRPCLTVSVRSSCAAGVEQIDLAAAPPAEAMRRPVGLTATLLAPSVKRASGLPNGAEDWEVPQRDRPVGASARRASLPSELKATLFTPPWWPTQRLAS